MATAFRLSFHFIGTEKEEKEGAWSSSSYPRKLWENPQTHKPSPKKIKACNESQCLPMVTLST